MEYLKVSILIAQLICAVFGKVLIIPDTKLEDCTNSSDPANIFDFSEFELIPEDDEHVYMNGTWKFLKELKKPWKTHLTMEKYERGKWLVQALDKHYADFCENMHAIGKPWTYVFEGKDKCPVAAGTSWYFDYLIIKFPELLLNTIPPHYMGRWRFVMNALLDVGNGNFKQDCKRIYADIHMI